jgi:hypothetical protein
MCGTAMVALPKVLGKEFPVSVKFIMVLVGNSGIPEFIGL